MKTEIVNKNTAEPLFNAGLAFLERLHKLSMFYHDAMARKDYSCAYSCLNGLTGESAPRISEEEYNNLKKHRMKASNIIQMLGRQNERISSNVPTPQFLLEEWFVDINMALHKHGLIMPNKDDMSNATKI